MAHWQHRDELKWSEFRFNQPYAKGLNQFKEEILGKADFDPAVLWQWGTMQSMAVIAVLKSCEVVFGQEGQKVVQDALREVGRDVGRQILNGTKLPKDMKPIEFISFYATVINRIVYASIENPRIDGEDRASFDIVWCPHQTTYTPFDCRVQRYFVQGMIDAAEEHVKGLRFEVRFDSTIPAGAQTCHFTLWRGKTDETSAWNEYTKQLEAKAIDIARREAKTGKSGAKSDTS